jgi:hypothetical protein
MLSQADTPVFQFLQAQRSIFALKQAGTAGEAYIMWP